jgi:hypothetical protein
MTTISPDSPLKISPWITLGLTAAGFVYIALAILIA